MTPSSAPSGSSRRSAVIFVDAEEVLIALRGAARRLRAAHPEIRRILLFGSRARGRATARSDADLLVVASRAEDPPHLRAAPYLLALGPTPVPIDLFVVTRAELDESWRRRLEGAVTLAP